MPRKTLNLGILAHVDAGKTTLSERLLYAAGVIEQIGSVDDGTTQTDSLALERQRGITIKSAVVSFAIGDITVNLIDTPGHPDFIAEVERVLSVLDGAVLVISAVEGVQAQTRVLMRALRRLRIPTLLFVNKIDRTGASTERVFQAISDRLALTAIPMGSATRLGTRDADVSPWDAADPVSRAGLAEVLAERDDGILAAYVEDAAGISGRRLRTELAGQAQRSLVYPVFFGSAITGAGVESLMAGIAELLPATAGDADGPVAGRVFKIERAAAGEKIAYVRMFSGTIHVRDRLGFGAGHEDKVTAVGVFDQGSAVPRSSVSAGQIAKLWGLHQIRIGDRVGDPIGDRAGLAGTGERGQQFAAPALESVVVPARPGDRARLRVALGQLAEQDPLINVRQDDAVEEISVSLYGEVQKEVIQATLAADFGVDVTFRETTMIYIERPAGAGSAAEVLQADTHPFSATVGLHVEPALPGSGISFRLDVDPRDVPLYIYKTAGSFAEAMTHYIRDALREGLSGWEVTDCIVTMNECNYYIGDGPKKRILSTPRTTAADFRKLTPLVLMSALERAGTVVCEPMMRVSLEVPAGAVGPMLAEVARLGGAGTPSPRGNLAVIRTVVPAARVQQLQRHVPGLTGGEGVVETRFGGYRPVTGTPPTRRRTTANPLNRDEYLTDRRTRGPALGERP